MQVGVTTAINQIIAGRDSLIPILTQNIETVLGEEFDMNTDDIDTKLAKLQDEIIQLASSKSEYDDKLTRQLVERVTVFEGKFHFVFKSGVDIDVKIGADIQK